MLPLNGVRVLAVEQYGAGPFGTMFLADQGAEVIKIENPFVTEHDRLQTLPHPTRGPIAFRIQNGLPCVDTMGPPRRRRGRSER